MHDTRINLLGFQIGQRSDAGWQLRKAGYHVHEARFFRRIAADAARHGEHDTARRWRADARWHLHRAGQLRRAYLARITPDPDQAAAWAAYPARRSA